jgi:cell wall-associated NlpC family hydrolase
MTATRSIETRSIEPALIVVRPGAARLTAAAALSLALAACASTSLKPTSPADSLSMPPGSDSSNSSATTHPTPDKRTLMVERAKSMLGQPYRFGGAAPGGFDCSGLVVYAASGAGIAVPRTAQEQLRTGIAVARGELQAGDLIFMHLAHKELHVGIAIDGERFVHAPSSGGFVRIDHLAAAPYSAGFEGARRLIGDR